MRRKVTIDDIARETELSRGTVSRAMNDRPDISRATKQRVLQACRKLNYAPSFAARCLATGRGFALIALVRDLRDPHAAAILSGAVRRAGTAGYLIHPVELPDSPEEAGSAIERFVSGRVDGVLVCEPLSEAAHHTLTEVIGARPVLHTYEAPPNASFVAPDWREAGRAAARFVSRNGQKRVLFVDDGVRAAAREGFLESTAAEHVHVEAVSAESVRHGPRAFGERLEGADGIVTVGVSAARTACLAAAGAGCWPGRQISILSIGDGPCATHIRPTLSAIDVNPSEIGARATEGILKRLDGEAHAPGTAELVGPRLIERESTRRPGDARPRPKRR